jgi:hypothetical protein
MAHTQRNCSYNRCVFRFPKTYNERRQIEGLLLEEDIQDFNLSKMNRIRKKKNLPTSWDDVVCSSYYEIYKP